MKNFNIRSVLNIGIPSYCKAWLIRIQGFFAKIVRVSYPKFLLIGHSKLLPGVIPIFITKFSHISWKLQPTGFWSCKYFVVIFFNVTGTLKQIFNCFWTFNEIFCTEVVEIKHTTEFKICDSETEK